MHIRSITLLAETDVAPSTWAPFLSAARGTLSAPVQTVRLATPPFPTWLAPQQAQAMAQVQALHHRWQAAGVDYISLGPAQRHHPDAWLEQLPDILASAPGVFASVVMADEAGVIDLPRIHRIAGLIQQLSRWLPDGFGNLFFAALANCRPGSPFFPAAYHAGGPPRLALALESADLAVNAFQAATSLAEARANLVGALEEEAGRLTQAMHALLADFSLPAATFAGLDFSLAPFPSDDRSLGRALELLGVPYVGAAGTLFAAAFVADALQRARFPRCGFSGLMLPVLEDSVLARRTAEGVLRVGDVLSYSAVCGVGLDTLPLPGEVTSAQLAAILLDVAGLAVRLDKPLTARLMPMPGKAAGDPITFDFPYFANSAVLSIAGPGWGGLLATAPPMGLMSLHPADRS